MRYPCFLRKAATGLRSLVNIRGADLGPKRETQKGIVFCAPDETKKPLRGIVNWNGKICVF